jgi:hypothetical protein
MSGGQEVEFQVIETRDWKFYYDQEINFLSHFSGDQKNYSGDQKFQKLHNLRLSISWKIYRGVGWGGEGGG